jgi:hypothetical protein
MLLYCRVSHNTGNMEIPAFESPSMDEVNITSRLSLPVFEINVVHPWVVPFYKSSPTCGGSFPLRVLQEIQPSLPIQLVSCALQKFLDTL